MSFPSPPAWLPFWPGLSRLAPLFPPAMSGLAQRLRSTTKVTAFFWDDDGILLTVDGHHRNRWDWRDGQWQRRCNCGYPKDTCVHAFMLAGMVENKLREMGLKGGERRDEQIVPLRREEPEEAQSNSARGLARSQASTSDSARGLARSQESQEEEEQVLPQELIAEVDLKGSIGNVVLRFMVRMPNGQNQIVKMQRLLSFCRQARDKRINFFDERDRRFLIWLFPTLARPENYQGDLNVLHVPRTTFDEWIRAWAEFPNRFIDRATQKPVAGKLEADIWFELEREESQVNFRCRIGTSEANAVDFFTIYPSVREKSLCELGGGTVRFTSPVSWSTLSEVFARKTPSFPLGKLNQVVPVLLEGNLELLRGAQIRHLRDGVQACLHASLRGPELILEMKSQLKGQALPPLDHDGRFFNVRHPQGVEAVRRFASELKIKPAGPDSWKAAADEELVVRFLARWHKSDEFPKVAGDNLLPLIDGLEITPEISLREGAGWLDCKVRWSAGGQQISPEELESLKRKGSGLLRQRDGSWLRLELGSVEQRIGLLSELGMESGGGRISRAASGDLLAKIGADLPLGADSKETARRLRDSVIAPLPEPPAALLAILRSYQIQGSEFLRSRLALGVGALLADDMGLGKTLQTLSALEPLLRSEKAPGLVVAPASVLHVWERECQRFLPDLPVTVLIGSPERRARLLAAALGKAHLLIASYSVIRNDLEALKAAGLAVLVLDEAQVIRNPEAQTTIAAKALKAPRRLALSGTPLENSLSDLWSLLDFLNPGLFASREDFGLRFQSPATRSVLSRRLRPLMLRRTKELVAPELPPRTEELIVLDLAEAHRQAYERQLAEARAEVKSKGPFAIFAALTRLRQTCIDARLGRDGGSDGRLSTKMDALSDMLAPLIERGESALVFSSFTGALDLAAEKLQADGIDTLLLTGETPLPQRMKLVDEFQNSSKPKVFLLSLKAAGTGLTLTRASYVFLLDPWWNPQAERQAIDRAHRIGQDKPVFVYRLVANDTIEEKVMKLQDEKRRLFAEIIEGGDHSLPEGLDARELAALLE